MYHFSKKKILLCLNKPFSSEVCACVRTCVSVCACVWFLCPSITHVEVLGQCSGVGLSITWVLEVRLRWSGLEAAVFPQWSFSPAWAFWLWDRKLWNEERFKCSKLAREMSQQLRSSGCSSRGSGFNFQHKHGASKTVCISSSEGLTAS